MSAFERKDRPLIERIYIENKDALLKVAFRRLQDVELTQEAMQTAACRFMESFDRIKGTSNRDLRGYLYKILLTVIGDIERRNAKEIPMPDVPRERSVLDNVEEFVLGKQGAQLLYEKIDQLPPRYGLYLEMAYIDKFPPDMIAAALGVEVSSLRTIASRARAKLADLCSEEESKVH